MKRKHFELNGKHKRFIRSSAIRQALIAKYRLLFATLTFPQDINQKEANKCFSNFVDNLSTNHKLHSYVAVKENTKKGRPHFHVILDIPFTDFKVLNKAWCASFRNHCNYSNNAFTTGRNPIVRSVDQVAKYITKYITKAERGNDSVKPTTRQYFVSQNVHCRPTVIPSWLKSYLLHKQGAEHYESDFFTWYRLYNFMDLPEVYLKEMERKTEENQSHKRKKDRRFKDPPPEKQLQIGTNWGVKVDLCYNS